MGLDEQAERTVYKQQNQKAKMRGKKIRRGGPDMR